MAFLVDLFVVHFKIAIPYFMGGNKNINETLV
jgi:hypothetical protein